MQLNNKNIKIEEASMDSDIESGVELIEIGGTSYGKIMLNKNGEIETQICMSKLTKLEEN